jgi:hypothetical protein
LVAAFFISFIELFLGKFYYYKQIQMHQGMQRQEQKAISLGQGMTSLHHI